MGDTATVQITSGNGNYTVVTSDEAIATATEADGTITITAKAEGNAEITVTDIKTNEAKKVNVTVISQNVSLVLDKEEVSLKVGDTATVQITSGNGNYTVVTSDDTIATAAEADRTITITGKAEGNAEITVTDTKTNEAKKIAVTVEKKEENPPTTGNLLFPGSDFEDWDLFKSSLNKYGVQKYATPSRKDGSKALHIQTKKGENPKKNAYVFTATVPENFAPKGKTKISFYIKGACAEKSISLNVYKEDGKYYPFNLGDCEADKELNNSPRNSYTGSIDTKGKWVKVTLNIADLDGIAKTKGNNLFAFKIGVVSKKGTDWDLLVDNITIE